MAKVVSRQLRNVSPLLALVVVAACSVEDLQFVPDSELAMAGAGDVGSGATTSNAGKGNTSSGSSTGGTTSEGGDDSGGTTSAGSDMGGSSALAGRAGAATGGMPPLGGMGGMGGMGMVACPAGARAYKDQPLIDDFEDGNGGLPMPMMGGRAGSWYVVTDANSPMAVLFPPADKTPNPIMMGFSSKFGMNFNGHGFRGWGVSLATNMLTIPDRKWPCAYDVSAHTGVKFVLRGAVADNTVRFGVTTVETTSLEFGGSCDPMRETCYDVFSYEINPVPAMWTQFTIPFDKLQQLNGGTMDFDRSHVFGIEFAVHGAQSSQGGVCVDGGQCKFDVWIDTVEFY